MEFAINYSYPTAQLLREGRIQVDRIKTPNWRWMMAEAAGLRPIAVHFDLQAGQPQTAATDWDQIAADLETSRTPYVNLHLSPLAKDFPEIPADRPDPALQERVVQAMLGDVGAAVARFGAERVIVENVPYRSGGRILRTAVKPEVISGVVDQSGCGLLLDISHARIAAHHLGMDACEYMDRLPVHRLRELHFTGLHLVNGGLQDHLPILETDWPVLDWVLDRIRLGSWSRPWMLAFEYGGVGGPFKDRSDPGAIAEQAPRLYEMVKSLA